MPLTRQRVDSDTLALPTGAPVEEGVWTVARCHGKPHPSRARRATEAGGRRAAGSLRAPALSQAPAPTQVDSPVAAGGRCRDLAFSLPQRPLFMGRWRRWEVM